MMVIHGVSSCNVIHGLLFTCLRALFGVSVLSILVCIFTLMLVYQLLSHQKKKRYLHQLEIRRRFHLQNRAFGAHSSHPSYVSQQISPQMVAHNRNHSLRQLAYGYCEDPFPNGWALPPHSYDNLDSRLYNRNVEEELPPMGPNRCNSWTNWLNWSRSQVSVSNNHIPNQSSNRRFFGFLRRNQNRESPNWVPHQHNGHTFLPPHVFIPRIGSGGLTSLPPHLTRFYRDNTLRRNVMTSLENSYRRTRSNEGIFQHMSHTADHSLYAPTTGNPSANMFALWGPPPPYTCSQPQSLNRINTICNGVNHSSMGQHCREASVHSSDVRPNSKMSTPLSERRIRCNAFSSDGIRLNIGPKDDYLAEETKSSCIVEIHVPYTEDQNQELKDGQKKSKLCFNTMPAQKKSEHLPAMNPFHSLSNIPITFPNGFVFEDKSPELTDSELESNKSKVETIRRQLFHQNRSTASSSTLNSTSNTMSEMSSSLVTDQSFSGNSFPVDPPTDYKSTLILQSSPTDKSSDNMAQRQAIDGQAVNGRLNSTQSMPNLSCVIPVSSSHSTSTRTQPKEWDLHRIPSSGNTSTSQDLADYDLEMDDESIKYCAELPNDNLKAKPVSDSYNSSKSSSLTESLTPELIKPPTPFNNQELSEDSATTPSTATLSSVGSPKPKPELIINIRGIQV